MVVTFLGFCGTLWILGEHGRCGLPVESASESFTRCVHLGSQVFLCIGVRGRNRDGRERGTEMVLRK